MFFYCARVQLCRICIRELTECGSPWPGQAERRCLCGSALVYYMLRVVCLAPREPLPLKHFVYSYIFVHSRSVALELW